MSSKQGQEKQFDLALPFNVDILVRPTKIRNIKIPDLTVMVSLPYTRAKKVAKVANILTCVLVDSLKAEKK